MTRMPTAVANSQFHPLVATPHDLLFLNTQDGWSISDTHHPERWVSARAFTRPTIADAMILN
jgi:hypothetical protein